MPRIVIEPSGTMKLIYDDDLRFLLDEGIGRIERASHVEPTVDGRWQADLAPVQGPVLGPFETRKEALAAEVAWLEANRL